MFSIKNMKKQILNLQAEINRVSLLEQNLLVKNKEVVLSNVINGSNQRF
jgi:membrane-bound inhibitor of C-type lysozyme